MAMCLAPTVEGAGELCLLLKVPRGLEVPSLLSCGLYFEGLNILTGYIQPFMAMRSNHFFVHLLLAIRDAEQPAK